MTESSQNEMRRKARELLTSGEVKVVIGWAEGSVPGRTAPIFVKNPEDAERLVWNKHCLNNLAVYLTRKEVKSLGKPAIIAKGCDIRAIVVLIQESQIKREDVHIIGMACEGMEGMACGACTVHNPHLYDTLIGGEIPQPASHEDSGDVDKIDTMDFAARWEFWHKELECCIKCYACRQACPLCYCTRCIVEKSQPQWISPAQHGQGNLAWNVIRAMHLASRCVECGACERACPMGIRIGLINRKLARIVREQFGYEAGTDAAAPPLMASFKQEDKEDFIK